MTTVVRMSKKQKERLFDHLFSRYPGGEWGTFAYFGWRINDDNTLVITLHDLRPPGTGDMSIFAPNVIFYEQYSLRVALESEKTNFAVGVIHSHPEGYFTKPSKIDDEMDAYFSDYYSGFAPNRPYVSLIFGRDSNTKVSATGRIFIDGSWRKVDKFCLEESTIVIGSYDEKIFPLKRKSKTARLTSALGEEAAARLEMSTAAVVGASGTGSPVIEILARAGVGNIIVIDPDDFDDSNLERIHGSSESDCETKISKVELAMRHIKSINKNCNVTGIIGAIPQPLVVDYIAKSDIVIGCTDKQHSRLALSDICIRYCITCIDCGVLIEGDNGEVTGQIIQLTKFSPDEPCALCRNMVTQWRLNQELMSNEERAARIAAANEAKSQNVPNPYWKNMPQLLTVGYLTTTAAGLASTYAIGYLTGRFHPPFQRLQMNLQATQFDVVEISDVRRPKCSCGKMVGSADQGMADTLISAPSHWKKVEIYK